MAAFEPKISGVFTDEERLVLEQVEILKEFRGLLKTLSGKSDLSARFDAAEPALQSRLCELWLSVAHYYRKTNYKQSDNFFNDVIIPIVLKQSEAQRLEFAKAYVIRYGMHDVQKFQLSEADRLELERHANEQLQRFPPLLQQVILMPLWQREIVRLYNF